MITSPSDIADYLEGYLEHVGCDTAWVNMDVMRQWKNITPRETRTLISTISNRICDRCGLKGRVYILAKKTIPPPPKQYRYRKKYYAYLVTKDKYKKAVMSEAIRNNGMEPYETK